ncbi:MAG: hypothetical protein K9K79_07290, partial [Desulfohalobiaceae bacterium]|nr:hypothetical protein [Desulfohalobiaceae bacterium]
PVRKEGADPKNWSFSIDQTGKDGLQHDELNFRPINSYILINYMSGLPEAGLTPETCEMSNFKVK